MEGVLGCAAWKLRSVSGSAGEAGDGDVASDFPTALAAAQNLGWEGRHQRALGDLHWLQGPPERARRGLPRRTHRSRTARQRRRGRPQPDPARIRHRALRPRPGHRGNRPRPPAPGRPQPACHHHQRPPATTSRCPAATASTTRSPRCAPNSISRASLADTRGAELAWAFTRPSSTTTPHCTARHAHPATRTTSDEDHAYLVDIAQFMADMPVTRLPRIQWLDSEQHTRSRWRGLVTARQAHLHAGH